MTNVNANDALAERAIRPRTDVFEDDERIELVLEMPGVDPSSVEATWTEDVLTVRGKPAPRPLEGWRAEWSEFELLPFERSLRIQRAIEREAIQATIENGSLRVVLQKQKPRSSRIEIKAP